LTVLRCDRADPVRTPDEESHRMNKTASALAIAGALALAVIASGPAAAQDRSFVPTVYPVGPSFAYWPAYYIYVPSRPAAAYVADPSAATRWVLYDDVYPPALYGPQLRPVPAYPRR
jgi:hypothetical protein